MRHRIALLCFLLLGWASLPATARGADTPQNKPEKPRPEPRPPTSKAEPLTDEDLEMLRNRELLQNWELLKNFEKIKYLDFLARPDDRPAAGTDEGPGKKTPAKSDVKKTPERPRP